MFNSSMLQDRNDVLCGYYCLYFIIHRWQVASTLGLPLLSVVRPREDSDGTVSRDVLFEKLREA